MEERFSVLSCSFYLAQLVQLLSFSALSFISFSLFVARAFHTILSRNFECSDIKMSLKQGKIDEHAYWSQCIHCIIKTFSYYKTLRHKKLLLSYEIRTTSLNTYVHTYVHTNTHIYTRFTCIYVCMQSTEEKNLHDARIYNV